MRVNSIQEKKKSNSRCNPRESVPVVDDINRQITFLRAMMTRIDALNSNAVDNRVDAMRTSILNGSVHPMRRASNSPF